MRVRIVDKDKEWLEFNKKISTLGFKMLDTYDPYWRCKVNDVLTINIQILEYKRMEIAIYRKVEPYSSKDSFEINMFRLTDLIPQIEELINYVQEESKK